MWKTFPGDLQLTAIVVKIGENMTSVSVRLRQDLVESARATAKAEFRTMQGEIEYWAMLGRAAVDSPELPISFIAQSLVSMAEPREDAQDFIPRSKASE